MFFFIGQSFYLIGLRFVSLCFSCGSWAIECYSLTDDINLEDVSVYRRVFFSFLCLLTFRRNRMENINFHEALK